MSSELTVLLAEFDQGESSDNLPEDKPTILVVDDDISMRRGLARTLGSKYNVLLAEEGRCGIELFKSNPVFAVILDVKMPGMSGFEVCAQMRSSSKPDVPILFLTAYQDEHDLQEVINQFHPFAYLDKGGSYDLTANVDKAVNFYQAQLATKFRLKDLEKRVRKIVFEEIEPDVAGGLACVPNIIGDECIDDTGDDYIYVRDFNTFETVGKTPRTSDEQIELALEWLRKKQPAWDRLSVLERNEVISRAYEKLLSWTCWDNVNASAGWFTPKVVRDDIIETSRWIIQSDDYLRWAFGKQKVDGNAIEGMGVVSVVSTATMFHTGAMPIKDALSVGNAVLLKNDSRNVFPQYMFARALWEEGAPIQVIGVDTTERPYVGRRYLIDGTDKLIFMGHRKKALEMAYGELIEEFRIEIGASDAQIAQFMSALLMPGDDVMTFTAHIGSDYIHYDADLQLASRMRAYDAFVHPRVCKRDAFSFTHPEVFDEVKDQFVMATDTLLSETKISPPNRKYFDKFIRPYVTEALKFGEIIYGANEPGKPIIIQAFESANGNHEFWRLLGSECLAQVHILCRGDDRSAIQVGREVAKTQFKKRILEFSVYHKNQSIFDRFQSARIACSVHDNEPTTAAFGVNKFRRHEGRCFAFDTAIVNHN